MEIKSLQTKLLALFLLVGILPVAATGLIFINSAKTDLQKEISNNLELFAETKEAQVFAYLDSFESRGIDFASDGIIRDLLKEITASGSATAVSDLINHLTFNKQPLDKTIIGINVDSLEGIVVASTDNKEMGHDESDDEYFQEGKKKVFTVDLFREAHFGQTNVFAVAAPLTDRTTGKLLGVIAVYFTGEKLHDILTGQFQARNGSSAVASSRLEYFETYLVSKSKIILVHPHKLADHAHFENMVVNTLPVRACLENNKETIGTYANYAGKQVIGASKCFPTRGWVLLSELDAKVGFAPIQELQSRLLLLIAAVSAFVIPAALLLSSYLTSPVKKLTKTIEDISKGKLDVKVEGIEREDELGDLARAFDRTLVSLKLAMRAGAPKLAEEKKGAVAAPAEKELQKSQKAEKLKKAKFK